MQYHPPVIHALRKVPLAIKKDLEKELERLIEMEILTKVTQPTPWVSSLVVARKLNGKLRVCIDPQDLNKGLQRAHYPMPTIEDILPDLSEAKCFSVLDAKDGFWHVRLDYESSLMTTFNSPSTGSVGSACLLESTEFQRNFSVASTKH